MLPTTNYWQNNQYKTVEFGKVEKTSSYFFDDTEQMELVWFQGHKWVRES
jgi:ATP-dependent DNA helicase RecG